MVLCDIEYMLWVQSLVRMRLSEHLGMKSRGEPNMAYEAQIGLFEATSWFMVSIWADQKLFLRPVRYAEQKS